MTGYRHMAQLHDRMLDCFCRNYHGMSKTERKEWMHDLVMLGRRLAEMKPDSRWAVIYGTRRP